MAGRERPAPDFASLGICAFPGMKSFRSSKSRRAGGVSPLFAARNRGLTPPARKKKQVLSRNQLEKQLFEVVLLVALAQLRQCPTCLHSSVADDGHPIA